MTITTTDKAPKQVAINDIGTAEDFLAAVEKTLKFFNDGDLIEGTVVKIDRDEVLLDVGYKTEGVIPSRELSIKHDVDPVEVVQVGDSVEALVLQKEDKEGRLILSKKRAQYERAWGDVEKIKEDDGVVTGTVIEVVKGGLIVDIGLRGFLPASLDRAAPRPRPRPRTSARRSRRRSSSWTRTATTWSCPAAPCSSRRSPRSAPRSSTTWPRARFARASFRPSSTSVPSSTWAASTASSTFPSCPGSTSSTPSEVVEVGQEVTVEILEVDLDRERVSLSLKATQEDPWQVFARTHAIGQVAPGKVTKLVPFGAFVRVADGIEGLVHISELSGKHVELAEQVVVGRRRGVRQGHRHRPRASPHLAVASSRPTRASTPTAPSSTRRSTAWLTEYDEQGNYKYPEGFDPETNEWHEGYETQREKWEQQYADAQARWEAHKKQVANANSQALAVAAGSSSLASPPALRWALSPTTLHSLRCARSCRTARKTSQAASNASAGRPHLHTVAGSFGSGHGVVSGIAIGAASVLPASMGSCV